MKTKQCLVIVMTLLCLCVKAQNLRVTGVVRDKSDVIIGASVMVKNSTVGTVTDMDGRYSVEVPANGVLIFSYIGYTPVEKQVDGQTVINVTMNDDVQAIDEVVVTAIGIKQQKKKLGYTTQQVNTEALDQPGTVSASVASCAITPCAERAKRETGRIALYLEIMLLIIFPSLFF